ncbi:MAG: UDP-N-acetylglucosamine 2-epimerase (non-hydrolyzing) [Candidatus Cloacimonas sp.]
MKIVQIVGARPQFIKLAPLSREVRKRHQEIIIHSGQHYDPQMNEVFFRDMEIPAPDYNLKVGSGSQALQTASILTALEPVLENERPDLVVVYGDTNTTLAGALCATKLNIKTAHIESCLRSFNKSMPEEINRIVADHLCDILFAPTETAMQNANKEGLQNKTYLVGDIMVDALLFGMRKAKNESQVLSHLKLAPESYCLLTLHRPYNVDDPKNLQQILTGLNQLQKNIIFPVHPRTRNILSKMHDKQFVNLRYIEPQAYLDFMMLMQNAEMIFTDSGGVQKEAYILKRPCVTLRPETEWLETVQSGWNFLLPVDSKDFPSAITAFQPPAEHPDLFGMNVAPKILKIMESQG